MTEARSGALTMLKSGCLSMIEHTKMGDMGNESDKAPDAIAEFQERRRAFDRLCNQLWNPKGNPDLLKMHNRDSTLCKILYPPHR